MKKISLAILLTVFIMFVGCAAQSELRTGIITSQENMIAAGAKAPEIKFLDTTGAIHQLNKAFNEEHKLVVFTGEKSCATEDSALIKAAKVFFRKDTPAMIVEIIGGEKGCDPAQKACVLKRSVPATNLITLCDISGETRKRYGTNDLASVYLIDPDGTVVAAEPFFKLDALLAKTSHLAQQSDIKWEKIEED